MGGTKRPRGQAAAGAPSPQTSQKRKGNIGNTTSNKQKNSPKNKQKNHNQLDNWISNLAKQASDPSSLSQNQSTKAERIEKRAAKQHRRDQKRQQKQHGRGNSAANDPEDDELAHTSTTQNSAKPAAASSSKKRSQAAAVTKNNSVQEISSSAGATTKQSKQRLKTLALFCREAAKRQKIASEGKYRPPFQGFPETTKSKKKRKKWDTDNIQPRPKDYGGLGLALPSLFLSVEDPSFVRLLEDEFQEHIDGFFGKQRTKAMKKQLDGKMLWRQMAKVKHTNQKVDGRKLADMTPDQRVEAMLKAGLF